MKISIKNVYSPGYHYECGEDLKNEVVLDVKENLSISEFPEWLTEIVKEYEPKLKLIEKLNVFANMIKDHVWGPCDFCAFGINYYNDDYDGSYMLIFSKA